MQIGVLLFFLNNCYSKSSLGFKIQTHYFKKFNIVDDLREKNLLESFKNQLFQLTERS